MTKGQHDIQVTEDGRYLMIEGRRWRASDPSLEDETKAALVSELMAARRAVYAGIKADDPSDIAAARTRVHDAKLALGERGRPWWEEPTELEVSTRAAATERSLARHRERGES